MNKTRKKFIRLLAEKPKTLFLIDGSGAFLTAFFLFAILRPFEEYVGMPKTVLTSLSAIAICFCAYSTACFLFLKKRWTPFIRLISCVNLFYCALTTSCIIAYYPLLTTTGIFYFCMEIAIICTLSFIELRVAAEIKKMNA